MRPLEGKRILVTRPVGQSAALAALIAAQGGEAVSFPLLDIAPVDDPGAVQSMAARLDEFSLIVFISPNAVDYGLPPLLGGRAWPGNVQAAAIGQSTVAKLAQFGIDKVIAPTERFDSEALLDLPPLQAERVQGQKVLILRGNGGRELLADTLRERGAEVDCVTCYQRSAPADGASIRALLHRRQLDAATISSSEGLRNLLALLDAEARAQLQTLPVFVPHARIVEVAHALGLLQVVLTGPADAGIINGLCNFEWRGYEREC
ncbi:uroporphyrinogen-III synthase [Propionivibrio limicola]|uniref:uroporphyrinogen-III synthase n=1 Tax=Propionivibrio limicola TaxID=167645 RepID=UPI0014781982|nr:uroporphyrinogen-III synthase [Propionivibrio limicola]